MPPATSSFPPIALVGDSCAVDLLAAMFGDPRVIEVKTCDSIDSEGLLILLRRHDKECRRRRRGRNRTHVPVLYIGTNDHLATATTENIRQIVLLLRRRFTHRPVVCVPAVEAHFAKKVESLAGVASCLLQVQRACPEVSLLHVNRIAEPRSTSPHVVTQPDVYEGYHPHTSFLPRLVDAVHMTAAQVALGGGASSVDTRTQDLEDLRSAISAGSSPQRRRCARLA